MSIMDKIFGNRATAMPVNQQQMKQPGNFPANPEITTDPNNPALPNSDTQEASKKSQSPMEQFQDLFKLDPAKLPKTQEPTFKDLTPEKLAEAAKTNDFTKLVTPEMQAAILKGGPEGVNTVVQLMQAMGQKSFGDSALAATKLIERNDKVQEQKMRDMVSDMIKSHTRNENLNSANPIFSNPAVAPMMSLLSTQVAQKYPELSSAEQAKMVQDYTLQFADAVNPSKKTDPNSKTDEKGNKTDWSDFFDE